jgi:hypothetical protein
MSTPELPLIDLPTCLTYLDALTDYVRAAEEGEEIPDDALTMLADVRAFAEALGANGPA